MDPCNSASRVMAILREAKQKTNTKFVEQVWAEVFNINEQNTNKRHRKIAHSLSLLSEEAESIKIALDLDTHDEFECSPLLNSIENLLAISQLNNQWLSLQPIVNRELFLCLAYCRQVLPVDEELADEEEIQNLINLLTELEDQLKDSKLPINTKKIIIANLNAIHLALDNYKILGVVSVKDAMKTVVGDVIANNAVFTENKDNEEVGAYKKIVTQVIKFTEKVTKSEKIITSGSKLLKHGSKAIEVIGEIL